MKYGPNTAAVETLLEQMAGLSPEQAEKISRQWVLSGLEVYVAVHEAQDLFVELNRAEPWRSARDHIWDTTPENVQGPAWDAARALIVRDRLDTGAFETLYGPWASVFGWPQ